MAEPDRAFAHEGAQDGEVRDLGSYWIMGYHDPDGLYGEVMWHKPGTGDDGVLERAQWTSVATG